MNGLAWKDGNYGRKWRRRGCVAIVAAVLWVASSALGQQAGNQPGGNLPNVLVPGGGPAGLFPGPGIQGNTRTGQGAAANADFESLIDLIQSTVAVETWAENGGGEAEIRPFPGGVMVDAAGVLSLRERGAAAGAGTRLAALRGKSPSRLAAKSLEGESEVEVAEEQVRRESDLRYVSLSRLEHEIARRQKLRQPLEPAMLTLAGLQRVRYVFVYPESGDLVVAGPAGDWTIEDGRIVSTRTGSPVVRLDDFLVLWRRENPAKSFFGCSINPRQESLTQTQEFLAVSSRTPLEPKQRKQWLGKLRDRVGKQDIEIFGVDPSSRVAGVLVAADYHMKLVGMGLAEGVDGVRSYLDAVEAAAKRGQTPAEMAVLRWWFALDYEGIASAPDGNAFELVGQGVQVLSENEMLAAQGQRVHTGKSDPLNREFAKAFTEHFTELALKYPVYGELRNLFDLAMVVALVEQEGLAQKAHWNSELFTGTQNLKLPNGHVPRVVETVINHRVVNRTQIIAGVSGGVMVAPADVKHEIARGTLQLPEGETVPPAVSEGRWWWDAE